MSRRMARERVLQVLFQIDLIRADAQKALKALQASLREESPDDSDLPGPPMEEEDFEFASSLLAGVSQRVGDLDQEIEKASLHWRIERMDRVDRNILRLGCFEILYREEIPPHVSINEAIELARRYGADNSWSFVNGILDRVARESGQV